MAEQANARDGARVGTVAGIPIQIGSSWWLLAAIMVALTLQSFPELGGATALLVGVGRAAALLASVLAHEVAHALVARWRGLTVHRIAANMLGGHTAFSTEGLTAGTSALVAASGPLTNLALGLVLSRLEPLTSGAFGIVISGAAWTNLALAVFNLLPGLPLDGGAIVEALGWRLTGRRERGMLVAGWSGRVFAALVLLGVAWFGTASGDWFSLIWGFLIASVLWNGASSAIAVARMRGQLHGITPRGAGAPVVVVPRDLPVGQLPNWAGAALVADDDGSPAFYYAPDFPLDPTLPVSAGLRRLPRTALVEVAPDGEVLPALAALRAAGLVVATSGGRPYAVLTPATVDQAIRSARTPN